MAANSLAGHPAGLHPDSGCGGHAKRDYQGNAWKHVAAGTCETIKTPTGMGSLTQMKGGTKG